MTLGPEEVAFLEGGLKKVYSDAVVVHIQCCRYPHGVGAYYRSMHIPHKELFDMDEKKLATDFLDNATDAIGARDTEQERSMERCIRAFNEMTGRNLSTEDGWLMMCFLKMSRMRAGSYREDDYVDLIGYSALMAEEAGVVSRLFDIDE